MHCVVSPCPSRDSRASVKGAVLLADAQGLLLFCGSLDTVAHVPPLVDRYGPSLKPDSAVLLYVVDIAKPLAVELAGTRLLLLPLAEGIAWNELVDEMRLEKSDFKGQSSGEKVATVYAAWKHYKANPPLVSLEDALAASSGAKRVIHGAV